MVALFARAWIEIRNYHTVFTKVRVALFARAWIEIVALHNLPAICSVALFARAWIEIGACLAGEYNVCKSPSLRGRGLKYHVRIHCQRFKSVALFARAWIEMKLLDYGNWH